MSTREDRSQIFILFGEIRLATGVRWMQGETRALPNWGAAASGRGSSASEFTYLFSIPLV